MNYEKEAYTVGVVLVQQGNPSDKTAPKKWYARFVSDKTVHYFAMCNDIAIAIGESSGKVQLVIDGMLHQIANNLVQGNIVDFGPFGSFSLSIINKDGVDKREDWNASHIDYARIIFHPGPQLKKMGETLRYQLREGGTTTVVVSTTEETFTLNDGETRTLRKTTYSDGTVKEEII